ncbi:unnamed protein product [Ilex paraguariensis]|uniref:Glucosamine-phosphate N-acetyltransferase n=1 Tax=Ilex paraguariensis TaxID=185542 RepID=A0ABC8QT61_9AQUA
MKCSREMAVSGTVSSQFRYPPAQIYSRKKDSRRQSRPPPSIFISTNPTHVNPLHLRDLYSHCNHSCHRFPNLGPDGGVDPVDVDKLRIALSHSFVVVSVFAKTEVDSNCGPLSSPEFDDLMGTGGDWVRRVMPSTPSSGRLVGFGRAVSDLGLTASIYDVMCLPGYALIAR